MKSIILPSLVAAVAFSSSIFGQSEPALPIPTPSPVSVSDRQVSRTQREQAFAALLEGQRYTWTASRSRSSTVVISTAKLAKDAFQRAVDLDPSLAEGYTAIAELAIVVPPSDIEESLKFAAKAVAVDKDNVGGHKILARLNTLKALMGTAFDPKFGKIAIAEWKEITRLDPRNAEAWAFLAALYERSKLPNERIEALRKWLASAPPLDLRFYRDVMGPGESVMPEAASIKLGAALIDIGKTSEAVEVLSVIVADSPEDNTAIELLREALDTADARSSAIAIQSLQQAIFANRSNLTLVRMLAQVQARSGKLDEAAAGLTRAAASIKAKDKYGSASLEVALGDLYNGAGRPADAILAYEKALTTRAIGDVAVVSAADREFAMLVFGKLIDTYKAAKRTTDVNTVIERARRVLGKDDLFADRQLIGFYRESGRRKEALAAVGALRLRFPADYSFARLEASIQTELGNVDQAVEMLRKFAAAKAVTGKTIPAGIPANPSIQPDLSAFDEFSNLLFISNLYSEAGRNTDAASAANEAFVIGGSEERRQIAKLTLASALQAGGSFELAETTLRELIKQTPGNPIALNNLGYFLVERNERLDEAVKMINEALSIDPSNPSYLDSLGWAYYRLGNFTEAEKHIRNAIRIDSTSSTIFEHLGDILIKQDKTDQAKISWQKALELTSDKTAITRLTSKLK